MASHYIIAMRPRHWVKSGFCLAALFVSGAATSLKNWLDVIPLLIVFSLISSAGYVVNDIINRGEDQKHPRKCKRPVASGKLSITGAIILALCLNALSFSIALTYYGNGRVFWCLSSYVALNLSYTFLLRKIVIVDLFAISFGFVLRVMSGAYAIGLAPSEWLMGLTYILALLLGLGKRKGELRLVDKAKIQVGETRSVLNLYGGELSSFAIVGVGIFLFIAYCLYCVVVQNGFPFIISALPVGIAISSYVREAGRSDTVEAPEKMLLEKSVIVGSFAIWVIMVSGFIYL